MKEGIMDLITKGIEHEKSKYPDWDDKKDKIKVEINFEDNSIKMHFKKIKKEG